ncbi:IS66 family insertion sequence element accessory protein TnpA, partial [Sporanaerobacter acetigenes]
MTERELWTKRIEDYRASDLTAVKWCEENNVPVHKLRYKITQFNKEKKQTLKETQWASVIPEKPVAEKETYPSL